MNEINREIDSQPSCWREAARRGSSLGDVLPAPGARVAAVGCGTSLFVAQSYARLRESTGHGETDAFAASEAPRARPYDAVLAISRSGTTTEVARYLGEVDGLHRIAVVGSADTPVAEMADAVVALDFADERSVVQTRFATSALALLRAHLGQDLEPLFGAAEMAIAADLPVDPLRPSHYVFLGHGWGVGLANEAALKMREAAHAVAESYPAMEYRHGPISLADGDSLVWAIGEVDAGVLEDAAATGATVVGGELDPMVELVLVQRTAVALAEARGLDPDRPRNLTRSVVLS